MELRQLRYFLKTRELLSFTDAARSLHISQSTLSQQIKQLEEELDVLLFDRVGKRIILTEAGELFARYAAASVKKANDGLLLLQDLNELKTGSMTIGVTHGLRYILIQTLIRFSTDFPQIHVRVVFGTSEALIRRLNDFELDVVLVFNESTTEKQLRYQPLFSSPMALVTAKKSALSGKRTVTMQEIAQLRLAIVATEGYNRDHFFRRLFNTHGLDPEFSVEVNDNAAVLELVKTGKWHTIMVQTSVRDKELHAIPIKNKDMVRTAMIISLKEAYEKKAVKKFVELLLTFKER